MDVEISSINNENEIENVQSCCLWDTHKSCSLHPDQSKYLSSILQKNSSSYFSELDKWSSSYVLIADLTDDMTDYLRHLNVIPRHQVMTNPILERDLILNRLYQHVDVNNVDLAICALHRYTFGVGWRINQRCHHSDHNVTFQESNLAQQRRKKSKGKLRVAPFYIVEKILGFPYGGKICDTHRKQMYKDLSLGDNFDINYITDDENSDNSDMDSISTFQSFAVGDEGTRDKTHDILVALGQSPIKSQSRASLEEQTPGAVRRQVAKLRQSVSAATTIVASAIAPGQADRLIDLAGLGGVVAPRSSMNQSNTTTDEDFLTHLIEMYKAYEEKHYPYDEKVRLLALIPKTWNLSSDKIARRFGCTLHAVKESRRLKVATTTPLHVEERPSIVRQRFEPNQIDHFLTWLINTNMLVSVAWGSTRLKLENGSTLTIPRQILQAKRIHAVHQYKIHCSEVNFQPLSDQCLNVGQLFDDIEKLIQQEPDEENRNELKYDFDLAVEHIYEMFRHRTRTVQQDTVKSKTLSSMSNTTAFHTIDWAQKILPQCFREGQAAYFGKKGMSALVGSFVFYDTSMNLITRTYILCLTRCDQTEQATLSGGFLILKQFHDDYPHINTLVKRSDNASVLGGHATPEGEWSLANSLGIKIIMRDYSEVQAGRDICDRIVGASKMRVKAYLHAGNDVVNASQIKLGMEYCGGVKNVKIGVGEVINNVDSIDSYPIADISMIRNIVYQNDYMVLRKASEIGPGRVINFKTLDIPINMKLIESFEPNAEFSFRINRINNNNNVHLENKERHDRKYTSFFFCSTDACIESFQSEDELIAHELIGRHTTKDSKLSANDTAKVLLFEKLRNGANNFQTNSQTTTTYNLPNNLPKHFSLFEKTGWALRVHKPPHRIDKSIKEFIQKIHAEEKLNGRKIAPEEYVRLIRLARNNDGTKKFSTSQYLTPSQVRTQVRQLANNKKSKDHSNSMSIDSVTNIASQRFNKNTTSVSILFHLPIIFVKLTILILKSSSRSSSRLRNTPSASPSTNIQRDDSTDTELDDEDFDAIDNVEQFESIREQFNQ
ncbi:unnamed protein product [Rotaria sp. Silwood2]|nr:unnamed protein product [Rotaria sp. Silwood2]